MLYPRFQCVLALADLGANIDAVNKLGEPALHVMLSHQRRRCVMALLNKGADAALTSHVKGDNALHLAVQVRIMDDSEIYRVPKSEGIQMLLLLLYPSLYLETFSINSKYP